MFTENILYKIPEGLAAGINSGVYSRIGAIIKHSDTGRIVGHVQETGVAQQILSNFAGSPFSPVSAVSSVVGNIQLSAITKMIETMQLLQYASIGVGIAGLGVSVAGFAIVNRKLNRIEQSVTSLSDRIDQHFQELHHRELRHVISKIKHLFEQSDIARTLDDWPTRFIDISQNLGEPSSMLRYEIGYLLTQDSYEEELFFLLLQPMLACDRSRVELLIEAGKYDTAYRLAENIGENYSQLFDSMSARQLLKRAENSRYFETKHTNPSRSTLMTQMQRVTDGLRDITDRALTTPLLIESLDKYSIDGRLYFNRLRSETNETLLLFDLEHNLT